MQNEFQLRSKSRGDAEAFAVASKRVLVADDDPALLRQVTEAIERDGFSAVPARDGGEALKIMQRDGDFVAAVLAVAMSHIQGPELVRYMKTEKRLMHIPIIMMSSLQNSTLSADAFSAGAQIFLPKPFALSQLLLMLHTLTGEGRTRKGG